MPSDSTLIAEIIELRKQNKELVAALRTLVCEDENACKDLGLPITADACNVDPETLALKKGALLILREHGKAARAALARAEE